MIKIGVIAVNVCDTETVACLIQKVLRNVVVIKMPTRGKSVVSNINHRVAQAYSNHPDLSIIIIVEDLESADCRQKVDQIQRSLQQVSAGKVMIQIAIKMIEAWYLALPEAIEIAFPNLRPFPLPKTLTDTIRNPKSELNKLFYNKLKLKYSEPLHGPQIASRFIYNPQKQYMNQSLMRFFAKITALQNQTPAI